MTDRLDQHTAQYILDAMKAARDRKRYGSTEERATERREDMLEAVEDTCGAIIAEGASRPPTLGAWMAAMCDSKLGEPWLSVVYRGQWKGVSACIISPPLKPRFARVETWDDEGARMSAIDCDSPAALLRALNALADEVPRG